jgi:hypothetical protein
LEGKEMNLKEADVWRFRVMVGDGMNGRNTLLLTPSQLRQVRRALDRVPSGDEDIPMMISWYDEGVDWRNTNHMDWEVNIIPLTAPYEKEKV